MRLGKKDIHGEKKLPWIGITLQVSRGDPGIHTHYLMSSLIIEFNFQLSRVSMSTPGTPLRRQSPPGSPRISSARSSIKMTSYRPSVTLTSPPSVSSSRRF